VTPVTYWPPKQEVWGENENLDALYTLLNPPSHLGNVEGTMDERSLVYATGGHDAPQALIFIGFDPAMRLEGLQPWKRRTVDGPHAAAGVGEMVDVDEREGRVSIDRKGKGKEREQCVQVQDVSVGRNMVGGEGDWLWTEKAMFLDIGLGFYFYS